MSKKIELEFSEEELDVKTCVKRFGKTLPFMVMVRTGEETYVVGEDEGYSFNRSEVYWLTHIVKIERIIAKDKNKRMVSIPVKYPVNFCYVWQKKEYGEPEQLSYLLERLEPGEHFIADGTQTMDMCNAEAQSLGKLEYLGMYKERFFIGNNILDDGKPFKDPIVIPFHSEVIVSPATGLADGTAEDFTKYLDDLISTTDKFKNAHNIEVFAEIALFDGHAEDFDGIEYDYVKPSNYLSWGDIKRLRPEANHDELTASPLYIEKKGPPPPRPARSQHDYDNVSSQRDRLPAIPPSNRKKSRGDRNETKREFIAPDNDADESEDMYEDAEGLHQQCELEDDIYEDPDAHDLDLPPPLLPRASRDEDTGHTTHRSKPLPKKPPKEKEKKGKSAPFKMLVNIVRPLQHFKPRTTSVSSLEIKAIAVETTPSPLQSPILASAAAAMVDGGTATPAAAQQRPLPLTPAAEKNKDYHEQENYEVIDIEDQKKNGNQAEASITSLMEELKKRQGNLDDNYLCPVDSSQSVMPVLESESGEQEEYETVSFGNKNPSIIPAGNVNIQGKGSSKLPPPVLKKPKTTTDPRKVQQDTTPIQPNTTPKQLITTPTQHVTTPLVLEGGGGGGGGGGVGGLGEECPYRSIKDVPRSVERMNQDEVSNCLKLLGLDKHVHTFEDNQVDGELLKELSQDILQEEPFGLSKFESLKLYNFVQGWRVKTGE